MQETNSGGLEMTKIVSLGEVIQEMLRLQEKHGN
ncbi:hypothetical protein LCGC14_1127380 [marine sediment metagenome]|uniref:Uncharacterized protein n=1 Tax=marine sediment metagenome TaxID=412755 RepID=A0A0F9MPZ9_9ZZZZ